MTLLPRLLCTAALALASASACAQWYPQFRTETPTAVIESNYWNDRLLSYDNGTARIGMGLWMDVSTAGNGGENDRCYSTEWCGTYDIVTYTVQARPGYRVTGVTMSATLAGVLAPAAPDPDAVVNGTANNFADLILVDAAAPSGEYEKVSEVDLHGTKDLTVSMNLDTDRLELHASAWAYVMQRATTFYDPGLEDFPPSYDWMNSLATLKVSNLVLTVNTAPVPEPETYAMLLAGLALLGVVARRRRA